MTRKRFNCLLSVRFGNSLIKSEEGLKYWKIFARIRITMLNKTIYVVQSKSSGTLLIKSKNHVSFIFGHCPHQDSFLVHLSSASGSSAVFKFFPKISSLHICEHHLPYLVKTASLQLRFHLGEKDKISNSGKWGGRWVTAMLDVHHWKRHSSGHLWRLFSLKYLWMWLHNSALTIGPSGEEFAVNVKNK